MVPSWLSLCISLHSHSTPGCFHNLQNRHSFPLIRMLLSELFYSLKCRFFPRFLRKKYPFVFGSMTNPALIISFPFNPSWFIHSRQFIVYAASNRLFFTPGSPRYITLGKNLWLSNFVLILFNSMYPSLLTSLKSRNILLFLNCFMSLLKKLAL